MRWAKRIGMVAVVVLVVVLVVVPALLLMGGRQWLRAGLPDYGRALTVSGLTAPVHIVRDLHAVPRIQAESMADAYFALGLVHCQDRLWQMDMMRRLGAGRLAEVMPSAVSDRVLRSDRAMRSLGLYRLAESSYAALAPEVRYALDVYAAGVNFCLSNWRGPLPVEFQMLGYRPEPWRPADSLVWSKLEALQLSGNFREELLRSRLSTILTPSQIGELFPTASAPATLADAGLDGRGLAELAERVTGALPPPLGPALASNEWVVDGAHSASGKPVLANDPHLGLQAPILWYLARIETPELTLAGATVPGVPFHVLGHNEAIAWGITNTGSDTQDLFVERLGSDPNRYETPLGAKPFDTRDEIIRHRDGTTETLTVRLTRHGPVLPEDSALGNTKTAAGHVLALAFTGLSERDTTSEALYRLNRARDWRGFVAALRLYQSPQVNFAYADTAGAIGFISPGLVPVRARGNGLLPAPGWNGNWDWTGTIPFESLPQAINPPTGRFVNANNAPAGPGYPFLLSAHWPDSARAERIETLLNRVGPQSVSASVAMQRDIFTAPARRLLPLMLPQPGPDTESLSRLGQTAVQLLRAWTFQAGRDQPAPLIFSWWLRELNRELFAERLGPMFPDYWDLHPQVIGHILGEAPSWCDQPGHPHSRSCTDLLHTSLETAMRDLAARRGDDPTVWRWGDEHRAALNHPLFSRLPVIGSLFAIGPPADGDAFTLNCGGSAIANADAPFRDIHGPGLRAVYDLADLDQSLFMIATGESGNPLSPYYSDFVQPWRDGSMVALGTTLAGPPLATTELRPQ